jgi:large repetitive protein
VPRTQYSQPLPAYQPMPGKSPNPFVRMLLIAIVTLVVAAVAASTLSGALASARAVSYPKPHVDIVQSTGSTVQAGTAVQFSAQVSTGHDLSFLWNFGDDSSASGPNVTHTYTNFGTYSVVLDATDPVGQSASAEQQLSVEPPLPTASFTWSADPSNPLTVDFDGSASTGDQLAYSWTFGDGQTESGDSAPQTQYSYAQTGTYSASLTVTDVAGQTSTPYTATVTVSIPKPHAAFTATVDPNDTYCVTFDATASTGYNLSYTWDFGDGTGTDSGQSPYYCYYSAGTYSVTLTVTDQDNQQDQNSQNVTVGQ